MMLFDLGKPFQLGYQAPIPNLLRTTREAGQTETQKKAPPARGSHQPPSWVLPAISGTVAGLSVAGWGHRQQWQAQRIQSLKKALFGTPTGQKLLKQLPTFKIPEVRFKSWIKDYGYHEPHKNRTTLRNGLPFEEHLRILGHETGHAYLWQQRQKHGLKNRNSLPEERFADLTGQRIKAEYTGQPLSYALERSRRWSRATEDAYRKDGLKGHFPRMNFGKEKYWVKKLFTPQERRWVING